MKIKENIILEYETLSLFSFNPEFEVLFVAILNSEFFSLEHMKEYCFFNPEFEVLLLCYPELGVLFLLKILNPEFEVLCLLLS